VVAHAIADVGGDGEGAELALRRMGVAVPLAGAGLRVGAVGAVSGVRNPIALARRVLEAA
jgi:isoaspartyl peptidase/L-asparaginase-like protein (Ntn-hydrolase superfamily)